MGLISDVLSCPRKVHLLHSDAAFDAFFAAPAAAKIVLMFWEQCGPCKTFLPAFLQFPAFRDCGDQPSLNEDDVPMILSRSDELLFGAVERRQVDLLKVRIPQFPWQNGYPTMGLLRGTLDAAPNQYVDKVARDTPLKFYGWIEALIPGTLAQPGVQQQIEPQLHKQATELAPQVIKALENQRKQAEQARQAARAPKQTTPASSFVPQPTTTGNRPHAVISGTSPQTNTKSGLVSTVAAQHNNTNVAVHSNVNPNAATPPPQHKVNMQTTSKMNAPTAPVNSNPVPRPITSRTPATRMWVHRFHPNFEQTPTNQTAASIIRDLIEFHGMQWNAVPDPNCAITPTIQLVRRDSTKAQLQIESEFTGTDALRHLSELSEQQKRIQAISASVPSSSKPSGSVLSTGTPVQSRK